MKKDRMYLAIIACFALGVSLAYADSRENSGKTHEQAHGDQMPGQMHGDMKEKMFKEMDTNGDGAISEAEFNAFHAKRFKEMDANGDGKITHEEMEAGHKKMMGKGKRFDEADANHDGALTREEAEKMPMLSKHFDEVDANKDGKVTREEMDAAMERKRHARDKKNNHMAIKKQGVP